MSNVVFAEPQEQDLAKEQLIAALEILVKLITNLLNNPKEQKYKVINTENQKIKQTLMSIEPRDAFLKLLETLGYVQNSDRSFEFHGEGYRVLRRGCQFVEEFVKQAIMSKPRTEEERMNREKNLIHQQEVALKKLEEDAYKQ